MKRLILSFLLIAATASAEFTPAEKTEVGKIALHVAEVGAAYNDIGNGIRDYGTLTARPQFISVLVASVDALWECHEAMRYLVNEVDRATAVPAGVSRVQACEAKSLAYADSLTALASFVVAENSAASTWAGFINNDANRIRNTNLDTFNGALTYLSPDPPSFPRVVGPHGDSSSAREHIATLSGHFLRAVALGTAIYREVEVWPVEGEANLHFREFIRYATGPARHITRVWAMDVGIVVHAQDITAINQDVAAGSGLRGPDFFRLLREVELFNGDPHQPPLHSGRVQPGGVVGNFAIGFSEFPRLLSKLHAANSHAEIMTWWTGISNTLTASPPTLARGNSNIIPAFFLALARAWEGGDLMVNSWIMFFHEIPSMPTGGCSAGEVCMVPPEPCPECPPSTECPNVSPQGVLVGDVLEVRCVEQ